MEDTPHPLNQSLHFSKITLGFLRIHHHPSQQSDGRTDGNCGLNLPSLASDTKMTLPIHPWSGLALQAPCSPTHPLLKKASWDSIKWKRLFQFFMHFQKRITCMLSSHHHYQTTNGHDPLHNCSRHTREGDTRWRRASMWPGKERPAREWDSRASQFTPGRC